MYESLMINGEVSHVDRQGGETTSNPAPNDTTTGQRITTGRTQSGHARTGSAISADDIIKVNGHEGKVSTLERMGWITRTPDGSIVANDPQKAREAKAAEVREKHKDARTVRTEQPQGQATEALSDEGAEAAITEFATKASAGDVVSAMAQLATADGSVESLKDDTVARIASSMGLEPGEVRERGEAVRAAFETQAHAAVASTGLEPQEVFNWAWEHHPEDMKRAMISQARERTTKGYQDLAQKFAVNLDQTNPDMILNAEFDEGIHAKRVGKDVVIVTPQGELQWRQAVKAGWVKLSRSGGGR